MVAKHKMTIKVELVGDIAELEKERRYRVEREESGRLFIVLNEGHPPRLGEQSIDEDALRRLDRFDGMLHSGGQLGRDVAELRREWPS